MGSQHSVQRLGRINACPKFRYRRVLILDKRQRIGLFLKSGMCVRDYSVKSSTTPIPPGKGMIGREGDDRKGRG